MRILYHHLPTYLHYWNINKIFGFWPKKNFSWILAKKYLLFCRHFVAFSCFRSELFTCSRLVLKDLSNLVLRIRLLSNIQLLTPFASGRKRLQSIEIKAGEYDRYNRNSQFSCCRKAFTVLPIFVSLVNSIQICVDGLALLQQFPVCKPLPVPPNTNNDYENLSWR